MPIQLLNLACIFIGIWLTYSSYKQYRPALFLVNVLATLFNFGVVVAWLVN